MKPSHRYCKNTSLNFASFVKVVTFFMSRETLIRKTIKNLAKLPDQNRKAVSDFSEFLLFKIDDKLITEGIQKLTANSLAFRFLQEEEDLYTVNDLTETFN